MQPNDPRQQRLMRVEWSARVTSPDLSDPGNLPSAAEAFERTLNSKLIDLARNNFNLTGAHAVGPMFVMLGQRVTPAVNVPAPPPRPVPDASPAAIMYLYLDGEEVKSREFDSIDEAKKQVVQDLKNGLKPFSMHLTSVQSFTEEQIAELIKDG